MSSTTLNALSAFFGAAGRQVNAPNVKRTGITEEVDNRDFPFDHFLPSMAIEFGQEFLFHNESKASLPFSNLFLGNRGNRVLAGAIHQMGPERGNADGQFQSNLAFFSSEGLLNERKSLLFSN